MKRISDATDFHRALVSGESAGGAEGEKAETR